MKKVVVTALLALVLTGCAVKNQGIYFWGDYSATAYDLKREPTVEHRAKHVQTLKNIVQNASSKGKKVPPGICAELALLVLEDKDVVAAKQLFEQEKTLFPESAKLMDAMISRLTQGAKQ